MGAQPQSVIASLVEVDAAELRRREAEAVVVAAPVEAGHAPHRAVHALAVEPVRAGVDDRIADAGIAVAGGGVPSRRWPRPPARLRPSRASSSASRPSTPAGHARAVDLAVVELRGMGAPPGRAVLGRGPEEIRVRRGRRRSEAPARVAGERERHDLREVVAVAVLDRLLVERGPRRARGSYDAATRYHWRATRGMSAVTASTVTPSPTRNSSAPPLRDAERVARARPSPASA